MLLQVNLVDYYLQTLHFPFSFAQCLQPVQFLQAVHFPVGLHLRP